MLGLTREGLYYGTSSLFNVEGSELTLPEPTWAALNLAEGEEIYVSPL